MREKERRQKEKEEYARQKAILEKEEEEKQQLAEKKRKEKEAAAVSIQAVMHEQTDSLLNNAPPHSSNQSAPHEDQSQCNNDKPSVKSVQQDEKEVIEQSLQTTSDAAENQLETNTRSKECIKKDGSAIVDSTAHPNNADTNTESRANTEVSSEMKNDPSNTVSQFSFKSYCHNYYIYKKIPSNAVCNTIFDKNHLPLLSMLQYLFILSINTMVLFQFWLD